MNGNAEMRRQAVLANVVKAREMIARVERTLSEERSVADSIGSREVQEATQDMARAQRFLLDANDEAIRLIAAVIAARTAARAKL